jgi:hypothetical protein
MRIARIATLVAVIAATGGTTAQAQSPSERGYDETLGVIGQVDTPSPQAAEAPSEDVTTTPEAAPTPAQPVAEEEGNLPFTGLDLGIVALMGAALLGTGFALRRSTHRSDAA